jgi:hypothetical protein
LLLTGHAVEHRSEHVIREFVKGHGFTVSAYVCLSVHWNRASKRAAIYKWLILIELTCSLSHFLTE